MRPGEETLGAGDQGLFVSPHCGQSEISLDTARFDSVTVLNFDPTPKLYYFTRTETAVPWGRNQRPT